jgi:hypothetical protein
MNNGTTRKRGLYRLHRTAETRQWYRLLGPLPLHISEHGGHLVAAYTKYWLHCLPVGSSTLQIVQVNAMKTRRKSMQDHSTVASILCQMSDEYSSYVEIFMYSGI